MRIRLSQSCKFNAQRLLRWPDSLGSDTNDDDTVAASTSSTGQMMRLIAALTHSSRFWDDSTTMVSTSKQERQETSVNQQHLHGRSSRSPRWVGQKVPSGGGGISGRAPASHRWHPADGSHFLCSIGCFMVFYPSLCHHVHVDAFALAAWVATFSNAWSTCTP